MAGEGRQVAAALEAVLGVATALVVDLGATAAGKGIH